MSTENPEIEKITLYPDPTIGKVLIHSEQPVKTILAHNIYGQLIATNSQSEIDLSNQPSGVYIVRVEWPDGSKIQQKIIRN